MEFSTSILTDFLIENGCTVLSQPRKHASFSWASAVPGETGSRSGTLVLCNVNVPGEGLSADGQNAISIAFPKQSDPGAPEAPSKTGYLVKAPAESSLDAAKLAEHVQTFLMSIVQWENDMNEAVLTGKPCIELLRLSEPILKSNVVLSDSTFTYLAHTPGIPAIEKSSRYLIEHGHYPTDVVKTAQSTWMGRQWLTQTKSVRHTTNPICDKPSINHLYRLDQQYGAQLVMICEKPVTDGQAFLFEILAKAVGNWLRLLWAKSNPFEKRYSALLSQLLSGKKLDADYLAQQASVLDIPSEALFKVCLVRSAWSTNATGYFAERVVAAVPGSLIALDGDNVAVVLYEKATASGELARMEDQLFDLVESLDAEVGVSQKLTSLADLGLGLQEAKIALRYGASKAGHFKGMGALLSKGKDDRVFRFKRYFPFFAADYHNPDVPAFVEGFAQRYDPLTAIANDDAKRGTNDLVVLRTFLLCEGRISQVCDVLGMHRNTVVYRLKRLEKVHRLTLTDPDERMFLRALALLPLANR